MTNLKVCVYDKKYAKGHEKEEYVICRRQRENPEAERILKERRYGR